MIFRILWRSRMPFYSDTLCSQKFYWRKNRTKHPLKQVKGSLSIKGKKLLQSILGSNVKSLQCPIFKEMTSQADFFFFCTWRLMLIQSVKPVIYWAHKDGSHLGRLCLLCFCKRHLMESDLLWQELYLTIGSVPWKSSSFFYTG